MNRSSSIKKTRMQALSVLLPQMFPDSKDFSLIYAEADEDVNYNLKLDHEEENFDGLQEFSFAHDNPQGSLVFADEIFDNGQIRPIFPIFNESFLIVDRQNKEISSLQPPMEKLFLEQHKCISTKLECKQEEPYNKRTEEMTIFEVDTSNESYKKCNSIEVSKQWRSQHDLKLCSNCEGHDTFVFLNPSSSTSSKQVRFNNGKGKFLTKNTTKDGQNKTAFSAYEKHYGMRRMRKESDKRRSFLPYKQELVGFFANANIFSRNIHPF